MLLLHLRISFVHHPFLCQDLGLLVDCLAFILLLLLSPLWLWRPRAVALLKCLRGCV